MNLRSCRSQLTLGNLSWLVWTICLRHWGRRRCDPFHIAYPTWVPTNFWGFNWVRKLKIPDSQNTWVVQKHSSCYLSDSGVPPSVHQNRKVSAFGWCPWHCNIRHLEVFLAKLIGAVGVWEVCSFISFSAPKISVNWKCSCYLKSECPLR